MINIEFVAYAIIYAIHHLYNIYTGQPEVIELIFKRFGHSASQLSILPGRGFSRAFK